MNKKINLIFIVILSIALVYAQYNLVSQEDFDKYLKELKEKGTLNPELIKNLENLHYSQKEQIISSIDSDSEKFWSQWKNDMNEKQKSALLKQVGLEKRNSFMEKYGKHYGVKFVNLGDENILFGEQNTIGNTGHYFQMDMIEAYNKKNPENKIISIEYKKGRENSLIFNYEKGNVAELSSEGEKNGFYFNPDSGHFGKLGEDGKVDEKNPLTGNWNKRGRLKISTNKEGTTMDFDFNRDYDGKAKDNTDFAQFTNSNKDSYSVFQHPKEEKEGKTVYELKPGKLTFDSEGKLIKMSDMYKNPEVKDDKKNWGGFFGKDTSIFYNEKDFGSEKGSRVLVDSEKGIIKSEVQRVETGIGVEAKNLFDKIKEEVDKFKVKLDKKLKEVSKGYDKLSKAKGNYENRDIGFFEKITGISKEGLKLELVKIRIREQLSKDLGLSQENWIVKTLSKEKGLTAMKNVLGFASEGLGAAGDFLSSVSEEIDSSTEYLDSPFLKSLNPATDSRINIQLNNAFARQLKNIEMYGGRLDIADVHGNLVPVIKKATSYGYILPSTLNKGNNYFEGINFNLNNYNFNDGKGQFIQIFSQNGKLNAIGTGLKNLKSVNGRYVIDAGGGVSYHYNVLGLFKGGGYEGSSERVLTADYKSSAINDALAFQKSANEEYRKIYEKYQQGGFTKSEAEELNKIYNENFIRYNEILNSKDVELSVSSSRLNQFMDSFSSSGGLKNNPIINKIQADTVYNDKNLQMLLLERGLTSRSEITTFVDQEISRIHNFIKSNSGTTLQFIKDSSNGIYQIKSGNSVYNVDPSAGPLISNTLPVIFGNGGIDSNGNFYLDTRNSRLGKSIIINVYGGHYEGVKASREAQRNADSIRQGITNTIENKVKGLIKNPASKGYKVYSPY